ncbi:unnamed protein product [marine sediment metagenome]|uniref:Uncharacterized protein n=1 Tax=marine sediment metagenome TaxID=412755 RepID=X0THJ0_9ZZZZ
MGELIRLNASQPIVEADGTMAQAFRTWSISISDLQPIIGIGTPEGIIEAPQFTLYLDSTGTTGTIQYRKMLPEIGGDRLKGWVLL